MTLKDIQDSFNVSLLYFAVFNFGANGELKSTGGNKMGDESHIFT
jgi:hypothetical protein